MVKLYSRQSPVSNVRTVSDTKRAFYNNFNRPVTSVYRRVIEELMVEMHLLSVSDDFVYDGIYALGIVTTYDTFMDGYRPEGDVEPIFTALCQALESSPEQYRNDAQQMLGTVEGMSLDDLKNLLNNLENAPHEGLAATLKDVAGRDRFKYSRAFGIGFYTLVAKIAPDLVKDKEKLMAFMKEAAESLSISFDKLQKDIELYRSNIDKMVQAKALMAEMLEAERKKREERAQAKAEKDKAAESGAAEGEKSAENGESTPVPAPAGEGDEQPPQG
jgi:photosystem II biogenesis protein Psp29